MDAWAWILLPGLVAVASGILAWFVMQSRMEVALARERERAAQERGELAEQRGALRAERLAMESLMQSNVRAAEESARRQALEEFLGELRVERRCLTRNELSRGRPCRAVVLQERMCLRGIPLTGWIERDAALEEGADDERLAAPMTALPAGVANLAEIPGPRPALAARASEPSLSSPHFRTAVGRGPWDARPWILGPVLAAVAAGLLWRAS